MGQAILLGAVVSSTDAAALFAVLRGSGLRLVQSSLLLNVCDETDDVDAHELKLHEFGLEIDSVLEMLGDRLEATPHALAAWADRIGKRGPYVKLDECVSGRVEAYRAALAEKIDPRLGNYARGIRDGDTCFSTQLVVELALKHLELTSDDVGSTLNELLMRRFAGVDKPGDPPAVKRSVDDGECGVVETDGAGEGDWESAEPSTAAAVAAGRA